jgi:uncharacterized protein (TIGR02246 family)
VTTQDTLRSLQDRAEITDLVYSFARALDEKDYQGFADLYAEDGHFRTPRIDPVGKAHLPGHIQGKLEHYRATQHIMSNVQITITGDTATSRSYVQAMHVTDPDTAEGHWLVGGRYDNEYVRTPDGWRFASVTLKPIWHLNNRPAWANG